MLRSKIINAWRCLYFGRVIADGKETKEQSTECERSEVRTNSNGIAIVPIKVSQTDECNAMNKF